MGNVCDVPVVRRSLEHKEQVGDGGAVAAAFSGLLCGNCAVLAQSGGRIGFGTARRVRTVKRPVRYSSDLEFFKGEGQYPVAGYMERIGLYAVVCAADRICCGAGKSVGAGAGGQYLVCGGLHYG